MGAYAIEPLGKGDRPCQGGREPNEGGHAISLGRVPTAELDNQGKGGGTPTVLPFSSKYPHANGKAMHVDLVCAPPHRSVFV